MHLRPFLVPRTPLIDDQFNAMPPVVLAHDGPVLVDERLHAVGLTKQLVVLGRVKLQRVTLGGKPMVGLAETQIPGVVVQAPAVDAVEKERALLSRLREESARPVEIVDVGTRRDELQVNPIVRDCGCETTVFGGLPLRPEIAAAPP